MQVNMQRPKTNSKIFTIKPIYSGLRRKKTNSFKFDCQATLKFHPLISFALQNG